MTTIQEKIAVMQAFADGKEIEYSLDDGKTWVACGVAVPMWNWGYTMYRVKKDMVDVYIKNAWPNIKPNCWTIEDRKKVKAGLEAVLKEFGGKQ